MYIQKRQTDIHTKRKHFSYKQTNRKLERYTLRLKMADKLPRVVL